MAIYTQLPVFKRSYDLLLYLIELSATLPKAFKYTLGERLQLEGIELVLAIYSSNAARDKNEPIAGARKHLESIRLLVRLLHDTKHINLRRMVFLNGLLEEVSKQLAGWQKMGSPA